MAGGGIDIDRSKARRVWHDYDAATWRHVCTYILCASLSNNDSEFEVEL